MKILGTDFSRKWILFDLDGKSYCVQFHDSYFKGVYGVEVWKNDQEENAKVMIPARINIRSTYPTWHLRCVELVLLICQTLQQLTVHKT